MNNNAWVKCLFIILMLKISETWAMGLRTMVALPVEKGGEVLRSTVIHNSEKTQTG
ncbi:MAG: hypothetical protein HRU20_06070 [Pseudomonadales bacterium]|nr:hypothetical protein [Pseudomonadales bacterium]